MVSLTCVVRCQNTSPLDSPNRRAQYSALAGRVNTLAGVEHGSQLAGHSVECESEAGEPSQWCQLPSRAPSDTLWFSSHESPAPVPGTRDRPTTLSLACAPLCHPNFDRLTAGLFELCLVQGTNRLLLRGRRPALPGVPLSFQELVGEGSPDQTHFHRP